MRHAEPALTGVLLGRRTDPPLSPAGRAAAARLGPFPDHTVYTSPLRRALETARALTAEPVILPDLAEIDFGLWDGLPWTEIERTYPTLARAKQEDWFSITPPEGEPWPTFTARVHRALVHILQGPLPTVIVAHVAVNSVLAHALAGTPTASFTQSYAETLTYSL